MRWTICYHLYYLKNVKNTHGGVLLLLKLQASVCNFTQSNTLAWVFFTFLKLYKWYQMNHNDFFCSIINVRFSNIFPFCYFNKFSVTEKLLLLLESFLRQFNPRCRFFFDPHKNIFLNNLVTVNEKPQ